MKTNPWKRQGLVYIATLQARMTNGGIYNVTRTLDFLSYHLILWYHGEEKLIDMAYRGIL